MSVFRSAAYQSAIRSYSCIRLRQPAGTSPRAQPLASRGWLCTQSGRS
jgi:hypothetical protein